MRFSFVTLFQVRLCGKCVKSPGNLHSGLLGSLLTGLFARAHINPDVKHTVGYAGTEEMVVDNNGALQQVARQFAAQCQLVATVVGVGIVFTFILINLTKLIMCGRLQVDEEGVNRMDEVRAHLPLAIAWRTMRCYSTSTSKRATS